jgi:trehalose 6-phosphate phosphatase
MNDILAPDNRSHVTRFAAAEVLLAFDYDGTLAPIVADRDRAAMRARTRRLLDEVCRLYPCAVISGRDEADLAPRVRGLALRHVVGNHGLIPDLHRSTFTTTIALAAPRLFAALRGVAGVEVEPKRTSLAIHYRKAPRLRAARAAIANAVAHLPVPVRVIEGKRVVNVLPLHGQNKGDTLRRLQARAGARVAIYVGDDATDEDVFALDAADDLLSVRVGRSRATRARFFLPKQRDIDGLLALLASLRAKRG